jgi:ParB family chromosome partitioning protein
MPTSTDAPRAPSANKKRLQGLVAETVKVLDRPAATPEAPRSTLERDGVRSKLRLNRASGVLSLDTVRPDPDQPRKVDTRSEKFLELVSSVREHGVLEPITVRHREDGDYFQIITGERRYHAALEAGLSEIPAIVRDVDDTTKAIHQLVENLQREDMNPVEEAAAFRRYLAATGQSQDQLAARIGKSKGYVSQILAIDEQLTRQEKTQLARVSPAKLPGKSLIYEALQVSDQKLRATILSGELTRTKAREAAAATKGKPLAGRPKTFARVFRAADATVTVRFEKKRNASREDVLDALDAARAELKREMR